MLQQLKLRPRLVIATVSALALGLCLPAEWRYTTRALLAWDFGTAMYIALAAWMMAYSSLDDIRCRAAAQDEGRIFMLLLTTFAAGASLAAIMAELAKVKELASHMQWMPVALAGLTVFLSWTFTQIIFTLHYAHEYYGEDDGIRAEGLEFPGHEDPDYWDFAYFSFVIGTAAQTADVNITSRTLRRVTTLHCIVSFFFNTTILALTVNIGAGLVNN